MGDRHGDNMFFAIFGVQRHNDGAGPVLVAFLAAFTMFAEPEI